ncbi:MAG: cobalt-precorrin-6A reductase [Nakamurella sp.]
MPPPSVLILGGTAEARALAARLTMAGVAVTSSLAGRVADPALPIGAVRIGGFGGPTGLADYLAAERIPLVVDATHPFATTMSASAATACMVAGTPLLRLARPGWSEHPNARSWRWVDTYPEAADAALSLGSRVFLTTGRTTLPHFAGLAHSFVLVRLVESANAGLPASWRPVLSRGPYTVDGERSLMLAHEIDVLVTKDSGGELTAAKLAAAAAAGIPVVVVRRPPLPATDVCEVSTVADAHDWVLRRLALVRG